MLSLSDTFGCLLSIFKHDHDNSCTPKYLGLPTLHHCDAFTVPSAPKNPRMRVTFCRKWSSLFLLEPWCFMIFILCQWAEAECAELNIDTIWMVPANKHYSEQGIPPACRCLWFYGMRAMGLAMLHHSKSFQGIPRAGNCHGARSTGTDIPQQSPKWNRGIQTEEHPNWGTHVKLFFGIHSVYKELQSLNDYFFFTLD